MTVDQPYKSVFLGRCITIKVLRDYILDAGLTDVDTIMMHQADFDELALEYHHTYKEHLPEPYLLLGVLIREEVKGLNRLGTVSIVENDTVSIRQKQIEQVDPYHIIYRCGFCGNLVDYNGGELDSEEFRRNAEYLNKFGNQVTVRHEYGYCCQHLWNPQEKPFQPEKPKIDYSTVEGKALMELTEEDFRLIQLRKSETPKYEVIYSCRNRGFSKIYFTPNEDSYSLRGFMLEEHEKIFTTEQLIRAIRDWRKD